MKLNMPPHTPSQNMTGILLQWRLRYVAFPVFPSSCNSPAQPNAPTFAALTLSSLISSTFLLSFFLSFLLTTDCKIIIIIIIIIIISIIIIIIYCNWVVTRWQLLFYM